MTEILLWAGVLLVAAAATAVVLERRPLEQSVLAGVLGLALALLFALLGAPEVALSEVVVGAVLVPAMVLIALAKVTGGSR